MANKNRLLFLMQYLMEHTDDNHSVTSGELQKLLAAEGCMATSRTIRDDLEALAEAGFDVIAEERNGLATTYHIGARTFEKPELQILIDAVSSSRFITVEKSRRLIDKLIGLAGVTDAQSLRTSRLVAQKVKAENQSIYYIMELIDQAIDAGRQISFQYETYGPDLEKRLRNDGKAYVVSPYARVWSEDRYYLLGWSEKHETVASFRIDHMRLPVITEKAVRPCPPDFDVSAYGSSIIRMFSGESERVTLRCDEALISKLIDRFGRENLRVVRQDERGVTVETEVSVSVTFFGWLLQYAGHMRIVGPEHVAARYKELLQKALNDL